MNTVEVRRKRKRTTPENPGMRKVRPSDDQSGAGLRKLHSPLDLLFLSQGMHQELMYHPHTYSLMCEIFPRQTLTNNAEISIFFISSTKRNGPAFLTLFPRMCRYGIGRKQLLG